MSDENVKTPVLDQAKQQLRPTEFGAPQAAALASADEIFLRCAPTLTGTEHRFTAAGVIDRDKQDLIEVLAHLAECMESNSTVNLLTGDVQTFVEPEWFERFRRALERHTGRRPEF